MAVKRYNHETGPRGRGGGLLPSNLQSDDHVGVHKMEVITAKNQISKTTNKRESMTWEEIDDDEEEYDVELLVKKKV